MRGMGLLVFGGATAAAAASAAVAWGAAAAATGASAAWDVTKEEADGRAEYSELASASVLATVI